MKAIRAITSLSAIAFVFAFSVFVPVHASNDSFSCPLDPFAERTIIHINEGLRADSSEGAATGGPINATLEAGTYDVTLVSYDDHTSKGGQSQFNEEWFLILADEANTEITRTSAIADLADSQDSLIQVVDQGFVVSEDVSLVTAFHNAYPGAVNSIDAVCAAFDKVDTDPEVCELTLTKEADKETVELGGEINYTLTLENTGTANCTGGGVEIHDIFAWGTTYVSHELTPSDHDSEEADHIDPGHIEVNLGTMPPGDFVTLDITVELDEHAECGWTLTNEAHYHSTETGEGGHVTAETLVTCEPKNPEPAQCLLYGVHDESGSDSQFLTVDADTTLVSTIGSLHDGKDIEGLDAHPTTGILYASGGSNGNLYTVDGDTGDLSLVGDTGFDDVEALSFKDTDGTLWGWAEGDGLIEINQTTGAGTLIFESGTKVEGIAWNNDGTLLYAAGGNKLHVYDPSDSSFTELASNLPNEVEALEILPSGMLLGGNHSDNTLFLYDIDEEKVVSSNYDMGSFDDIEGLAWPLQCGDFPPSDNTPPVITLIDDNPLNIDVGDSFTDPGATADDAEDGDITDKIDVGGDTVDTSTEGTFEITYDVEDSEGLAAPQVTRTVNVIAPNNSCPFVEKDGRTIVDFPDGVKILDGGETSPLSVDLDPGTYTVTLATFDGYNGRQNANQPQEYWKAVLLSENAEVAETNITTDLRDDVDFTKRVDEVNESLVLANTIDAIIARHGAPASAPTANSLEPVCAAFDLKPHVPQCSDGIDNDGDGTIDHNGFVDGDAVFLPDEGCDGPDDDSENTPPAITLTDGDITLIVGNSFTDPGATADDAEDGDITSNIVTAGDTVDSNTLGSYVVTYDVTDSEGLAAPQVTRTVTVVEGTPVCSDGIDNDGDGVNDEDDPGCHTDGDPDNPDSYDPNDDDENTPPVITVLGDNPLELNLGDTFIEPGRTAADAEDGDLTPDIITNGDVVDTNTEGSYTITYKVFDSEGLTDEESRVVNVSPFTPAACSDGIDNDGDGLIDGQDNGCHTDNDENNPDSHDPDDDDENSAPEITLIDGDVTVVLNQTFTDPGATANDVEDGVITSSIVVGGDTVDTSTLGNYTVTYNVSDSEGVPAPEVTRVVHVIPGGGGGPTPACSDQSDNDGDEFADANDPGCHTDGDPDNPDSYDPNDDDENSAPEITLIDGDISLTVGDGFSDPGATASDEEDGDITEDIVTGGDTVDPNTVGSYTITYDVTDSDGASAPQVTRTVTVGSGGGGCTTNCGGGLPPLTITNEAVTVPSSGVAVVTWRTNIPATSQVVYDDDSNASPTTPPNYGYESITTETVGIHVNHRFEITGLTPGTQYFFRPVSKAPNVPRGIGDEVTFTLGGEPPVIPPAGQCNFLEDYLRIDFDNDPDEVTKLQTFLRDFEGFTDLEVTGVFDQSTFDAVSAFQARYADEVLDPWSLPGTTGYVYYTTQQKINEIFCSRAFPLTQNQLAEIEDFKALIESLQTQQPGGITPEIEQEIEDLEGQVGVGPSTPGVGGGGTLAITQPTPGTTGPGTTNVLEGSDAAGALGFLPQETDSVQEGTQVASLIGTVGTSGALSAFEGGDVIGGVTDETDESGTERQGQNLMATLFGNLTPSIGRGITIAGIIVLLAYLALSRVGDRRTQSFTQAETVPDVDDSGEGTILEV